MDILWILPITAFSNNGKCLAINIFPHPLAYDVKNILRGDHLEGIYRRAGSGHRQLHHRPQCYRQADGEKIWNQQIDCTYGSNKIERKIKNTVWIVE